MKQQKFKNSYKINKLNFKNIKKKYIKNKIITNFMTYGQKNTSEKALLKSFKKLQKYSNKQSKKLLQLSIIFTLPVFKLHKINNKKLKKKTKKIKEISSFIHNKNIRISLAIKNILRTIRKEKYHFFDNLKQEIIFNSQFKSSSIHSKNEIQKQALTKKHYLINYRW